MENPLDIQIKIDAKVFTKDPIARITKKQILKNSLR